jgi:hypothetical protein
VRLRSLVAGVVALLGLAGTIKPASAQSDQPSIDLVVNAGRPLRVTLDERIQLKTVGQLVTGTETEPVYAYNRIVPPKHAVLRFDTVLFAAPLGALHAIDVGSADRVAVDDEDGTTFENWKTRFVSPSRPRFRR